MECRTGSSLSIPKTIPVSLLCLVMLLAVTVGCGGERFPVAPVSGSITLDGQPLAGARIGFEPRKIGDNPNAGPGSYATTDAQGRYELTTLTGQSGAVVTTHDIWIRTAVAAADRSGEVIEAAPEKVPARYNDESTLTFEVTSAGSTAANFALTSESNE